MTRLAEEKRKELVQVEQELRAVYKSLGNGTLSLDREAESDRSDRSQTLPAESEVTIPEYPYDVFISHASEDKTEIVRPLGTC